jgi:hypothetical protein
VLFYDLFTIDWHTGAIVTVKAIDDRSETIDKGVTLTVEPGVVVRFDGNTGLVVRGKLVAVGNAARPITFSGTSPTPGSWRGIPMEGTVPLTGSVLKHVIVEYGGGAISYAANLYLTYATLTIHQSTFRHGSRDGIYGFNGGNVHMTHSHFAGNGVDAVAIGGTQIPQ